MNKVVTIIIMLVISSMGGTSVMAQSPRPVVQYVQNLELAKIILRPVHKQLTLTRDPFNPLIPPAPKVKPLSSKLILQRDLSDVRVLGIVRLGDDYRAYMMVGYTSMVVGIGDKVRNYTIIDMGMDKVVFKSGNKEISKKRSHS